MTIQIEDKQGFLDGIVQCTVNYSKNPGGMGDCVETVINKFGSVGSLKPKSKKRSGGSRGASPWNLAVKDCFSRGVDMKACSPWWKGLSQSEKDAVVAKNK